MRWISDSATPSSRAAGESPRPRFWRARRRAGVVRCAPLRSTPNCDRNPFSAWCGSCARVRDGGSVAGAAAVLWVGGAGRRKAAPAMTGDAVLDELGREAIEAAIGSAVDAREDRWCGYLDAELSENEDDPDWAAEELHQWRLVELRKAGAFLVA